VTKVMNNNIVTFTAPAHVAGAGHRNLADTPANVIELIQTPGEARSQVTADKASTQGLALTRADVWGAISDERVLVHYQPQYELSTGEMVAAEALVRLIDTEGQLIYPDRFIELAEQSDLIAPLGRAVIEQVCADLGACRRDGFGLQRVAINLAAHQLNIDADLPDFVDQSLTRHGLQPEDLEFELTERQGLVENGEGLGVLSTLAERGSRIVIDDFGMGYSSVAYLMLDDLPVSAIKLDRTLVCRLPDDKTMQCVARSLRRVLKRLNKANTSRAPAVHMPRDLATPGLWASLIFRNSLPTAGRGTTASQIIFAVRSLAENQSGSMTVQGVKEPEFAPKR
jgi:EAL domain-containing protein (putative c-di-GMP-specific phosphodiesterase class I)